MNRGTISRRWTAKQLKDVVALLRRMHASTGFLTKAEVILSSQSMLLISYIASPVLLVVWSDPQNFSKEDLS